MKCYFAEKAEMTIVSTLDTTGPGSQVNASWIENDRYTRGAYLVIFYRVRVGSCCVVPK